MSPLPWLLLVAGFVAAMALSSTGSSAVPWEVLVAVAAAAAWPRSRLPVLAALDAVRRPSQRQARMAAIAIAACSAAYLLLTALRQQRGFYPRFHDEYSYLIQAQMLARGRLWMPAHPMAPFFESFQLLAEPVYASVYFPGTALLLVPANLLHFPDATIPLLASGAVVGLVYLVVGELLDGAAGALAALMMLSLQLFRAISIMVLSQTPLLLLGLLMTWAWLEWRRDGSRSWALVLGLASGWAAVTRPLDALCFALPIGCAMLFRDLRQRPRGAALATVAAIVLAAAPFLALQLVFDVGVTGSAFTTPFGFYAERDNPQTSLGLHGFDPSRRPVSSLPQKQAYHDTFTVRQIQAHQLDRLAQDWVERRLPWTLGFGLPHFLLAAFVPPALLGLADRRRLAVAAVLPLFLCGYSFYGFFLSHYTIVAAPALILLVLTGARTLERSWPAQSRAIATAAALLVVVLSVTNFSEVNADANDELYPAPSLRIINEKLPGYVKAPAVVLFTFSRGDNPHEEPVYNSDVAWPDDAPIIRAHDRGREDVNLVRYYAESQPDRLFYLYNRSGNVLLPLGRAGDLAARNPPKPAP